MTITDPPVARWTAWHREAIADMDTWLDMAEQCQRRADNKARDVGFARVHVNDVKPGDVLVIRSERCVVATVDHRTDMVSSWYSVTTESPDGDRPVRCFDDGERVCRLLPTEDQEPI